MSIAMNLTQYGSYGAPLVLVGMGCIAWKKEDIRRVFANTVTACASLAAFLWGTARIVRYSEPGMMKVVCAALPILGINLAEAIGSSWSSSRPKRNENKSKSKLDDDVITSEKHFNVKKPDDDFDIRSKHFSLGKPYDDLDSGNLSDEKETTTPSKNRRTENKEIVKRITGYGFEQTFFDIGNFGLDDNCYRSSRDGKSVYLRIGELVYFKIAPKDNKICSFLNELGLKEKFSEDEENSNIINDDDTNSKIIGKSLSKSTLIIEKKLSKEKVKKVTKELLRLGFRPDFGKINLNISEYTEEIKYINDNQKKRLVWVKVNSAIYCLKQIVKKTERFKNLDDPLKSLGFHKVEFF